jgi:hypothetical protein
MLSVFEVVRYIKSVMEDQRVLLVALLSSSNAVYFRALCNGMLYLSVNNYASVCIKRVIYVEMPLCITSDCSSA